MGGNHPLVDGNKRIAVTAAFVFLTLNGYDVCAEEDTVFEFIDGLFATPEFAFIRLEFWIRNHTRPT